MSELGILHSFAIGVIDVHIIHCSDDADIVAYLTEVVKLQLQDEYRQLKDGAKFHTYFRKFRRSWAENWRCGECALCRSEPP